MKRKQIQFSFASGSNVSDGKEVGPDGLANIRWPASMDGAAVVLQAAEVPNSGTIAAATWEDCIDASGNLLTVAISTGKRACLQPDLLRGIGFVRLRSITAGGADQNQSAARTVDAWLVSSGRE